MRAIDLMLSLPWLFLLLAARALLPLNAPPVASLAMTYGLLAVLGWAGPARVIRAGTRKLRESDFTLQASAEGCGRLRILWRHVIPNLQAGAAGAVMDHHPRLHSGGGQPGPAGIERQRALPHLGKPLARTAKSVLLRPEAFAPLAVVMLSVACFKLATPRSGAPHMKRCFVLLAMLGLAPAGARAAQAPSELRFCLRAEPKTFDPLLVEDDNSETIRYLTGGVLIRINRKTQQLTPELATSWNVDTPGTAHHVSLCVPT